MVRKCLPAVLSKKRSNNVAGTTNAIKMKRIFLLILLLFTAFSMNAQQTKVIYTCVMHPQIKMDKPGNCPICSMTLIKKTIKVSPPKPATQQMKQPREKQPGTKDEMKGMDMQKPDEKSEGHKHEVKQMDVDMHDQPKESKEDIKVAEELMGNSVNMLPGKTVVYHLYVTPKSSLNFVFRLKYNLLNVFGNK